MSDMLDKIKDLLNQPQGGDEGPLSAEEVATIPPLEEAVEKALYSLNEIYLYGTYGRVDECAREAKEALDAITALKEKWIEQNQIMEALSSPDGTIADREE